MGKLRVRKKKTLSVKNKKFTLLPDQYNEGYLIKDFPGSGHRFRVCSEAEAFRVIFNKLYRKVTSPNKITNLLDPLQGHGALDDIIELTIKSTAEGLQKLKKYVSSDPEGFAYDFLTNFTGFIEDNEDIRKKPRGKHKKSNWIKKQIESQSVKLFLITSYWLKKSRKAWPKSFKSLINALVQEGYCDKCDIKEKKAISITKKIVSITSFGELAIQDFNMEEMHSFKDSEFKRTYLSPSYVRVMSRRFNPEISDLNKLTDLWIADLHFPPKTFA